MFVWLNGSLVPEHAAGISVLDHGFTVGDGVFETLKVVRGVPFAPSRHLARLKRSATAIGLPSPDLDQVRAAISEVVGAATDPPELGRLRITFSSGAGPMGSDRGDAAPTLALVYTRATPWSPSTAACVSRWPRNERSPLAGVKSTSYAENVVALAQAKGLGGTEAVLGNLAGFLCEGTGSNIFVALDGELLTPALSSGCLAGITRALVLEWTNAKEATIPMAELSRADEVFLTSSTRDVHPVTKLDQRRLEVGPLSRAAAKVFARRSAEDPDP